MNLSEIYKTLKKGVKAGIMEIKKSNIIQDEQTIGMVKEFNQSRKRLMMITGQRYYEADPDILKRKLTRMIDGVSVEESYKANNKVAHSKYKLMVDEKIGYLLSKPYTIDCEDKTYTEKIKDVLGKHFNYTLSGLGYEASNKGIAWLQPFINEQGKLDTLIIPAEQCIPIWQDNSHKELDGMIRVYESTEWKGSNKITVTNVEMWTKDGVTFYTLQDDALFFNANKSNDIDAGGPISHFKRDDVWVSWGKVPFIPFKNNRVEMSDLSFVKPLIDEYDKSRSEAANYVEEVKNLIFVLYGYGGQDLHEFMRVLNEDRAIPLDDKESGGLETLTPTMDITALREHYEQLKRDLIEDGQSINKDLDKFGSAPSGVALKFMYAGIDLKCNALETEFKMGFENLLYFVDIYLNEINQGGYENIEVDIVFNRDMKINESESIANCGASLGVVSNKTIVANHPWVDDIEKELEQIKEQTETYKLDQVELIEDDAGGITDGNTD